jgi:hypothetical protein
MHRQNCQLRAERKLGGKAEALTLQFFGDRFGLQEEQEVIGAAGF